MDNVTHTLAGVVLANAFFRERFGKAAVPLLAVASNLPDIDAVVMLTGRPDAIALRRTFGHSLLLLPLWCGLLAWAWRGRWPDKPYASILGLVAAGAAGHLLLDLVNSFGVVLLWPLSAWRPELAITFIIDLALTAILAAPLLSRLASNSERRLIWTSRLSAALAALYLGASWTLRQRADGLLAADRAAAGRAAAFAYVFPEPFGPHRWRGVEKDGERWRVYLIGAGGTVIKARELDDHAADAAVALARRSVLGDRLSTFLKAPVWEVSGAPGEPRRALVRDLRFDPLLFKRAAPFAWIFTVSPDGTVTTGRPGI